MSDQQPEPITPRDKFAAVLWAFASQVLIGRARDDVDAACEELLTGLQEFAWIQPSLRELGLLPSEEPPEVEL